ncbi:MAG: symmetrical bis(5'-nucleosyl)-tetraphosphatase [Sulfurovum sp.]|nr:symmetrical bis(5'-nucleosyl)-tetraphosphatase [Sulfurovum sp.]MCB4773937.1 symmetrical bis(5'-nucleosyl)-tetraphosphatase [Sulfurovum sp.]MCB4776493.1 symmetrical bis(5'-nucleosyl)-tetraphosphatase [Sulfurovum sp.]MCB4782360.1 symmetrical bis(5'-nucleosyl)-tetraphosphatase [Sulfurovum sp.]
MAVWAIGDIQGCFGAFQKLLQKIQFNPYYDTLWLAGDIVNRGDSSLETLEYLYNIRDAVKLVLGNHDIMLIAAYYGIRKSNPTIDPILSSPIAKELIEWLQSQKILHVDFSLGYCMAHAGISPEFDLGMAMEYAKRIETKLQSSSATEWLMKVFKCGIDRFDRHASPEDIDRYVVSSFTRMRYCYKDNQLDFKQKGAPTTEVRSKGMKPWFECDNRKEIELKIIFGHWSTLGFYHDENVLALDTGCLWGGKLTAARIDLLEPKIIQLDCR